MAASNTSSQRDRVNIRKAPYAPISAMRKFFEGARRAKTPARIDVAYLRARGLAAKNEWAFISALKFLGLVDENGHPTRSFQALQRSTDSFAEALASCVASAYAPLFADGGALMGQAELRAWFAQHSSPSQAANAARFFSEMCRLSGIDLLAHRKSTALNVDRSSVARNGRQMPTTSLPGDATSQEASRRLLVEKVPSFPSWTGTPQEYVRVIELFGDLMKGL